MQTAGGILLVFIVVMGIYSLAQMQLDQPPPVETTITLTDAKALVTDRFNQLRDGDFIKARDWLTNTGNLYGESYAPLSGLVVECYSWGFSLDHPAGEEGFSASLFTPMDDGKLADEDRPALCQHMLDLLRGALNPQTPPDR